MSEIDNIHNTESGLTDDKLFDMLSQLRVPPSAMDNDAAWDKLVLGVRREQRWDRLRIGFMRWGAAAVLLIIVSSILIEWQFSTKTLVAPAGKIAYALLPDSSKVTLNAGTTIEHREFGFNGDRKVKLKGEALFDVKPSDVDFVVVAGNHTVKVIGTRFNVYFRNDFFEVKCISGSIEVSVNQMPSKVLGLGHGLSFVPTQASPVELKVDVIRSTSWTKGEFYYSQTPLSTVFDEIQRQFNVKIQTQGFNPHQRMYSGYFTIDNLSNALDLVCIPMQLTHEIDRRNSVILIYPNIR